MRESFRIKRPNSFQRKTHLKKRSDKEKPLSMREKKMKRNLLNYKPKS